MPTVYVVQNVPGRNILPAARFGDLYILLDGDESPEEACKSLSRQLVKFQPEDFLLLIGSPVNIGMAVYYAKLAINKMVLEREYQNPSRAQLLVWDKKHYSYLVVKV